MEIHGVCRADSPAGAWNIFVALKLNKELNWFHLLVDAFLNLVLEQEYFRGKRSTFIDYNLFASRNPCGLKSFRRLSSQQG